jgi:hypothetical protein
MRFLTHHTMGQVLRGTAWRRGATPGLYVESLTAAYVKPSLCTARYLFVQDQQ